MVSVWILLWSWGIFTFPFVNLYLYVRIKHNHAVKCFSEFLYRLRQAIIVLNSVSYLIDVFPWFGTNYDWRCWTLVVVQHHYAVLLWNICLIETMYILIIGFLSTSNNYKHSKTFLHEYFCLMPISFWKMCHQILSGFKILFLAKCII